jgi:hypothetical protein
LILAINAELVTTVTVVQSLQHLIQRKEVVIFALLVTTVQPTVLKRILVPLVHFIQLKELLLFQIVCLVQLVITVVHQVCLILQVNVMQVIIVHHLIRGLMQQRMDIKEAKLKHLQSMMSVLLDIFVHKDQYLLKNVPLVHLPH